MRVLRYGTDGKFPASELNLLIQERLRVRKQNRVAVMADDDETFQALRKFDLDWLDPRSDYHWSGWKWQRLVSERAKRVVAGRYDHWFQWFMRTQRFRAFQIVVLIDPIPDLLDEEYGGYLDGLIARLFGKTREVIIVSRSIMAPITAADTRRTNEVIRALLYGTRMSKTELREQARLTFVPTPDDLVVKGLGSLERNWSRYQLRSYDEELLQGMVPEAPPRGEDGGPGQVEQFFERERRFRAEARLPDEMLAKRAVEDVGRRSWVTVPLEVEELGTWLHELNKDGDRRIIATYESMEDPKGDQGALLNPHRNEVRRILDGLADGGKLEKRMWHREVGRPAVAYVLPGKAPFLERSCGQCAFYVPEKTRCRIWWLANKTEPFFGPRWQSRESMVTAFERHKMKYASRIGPRSSACLRFVDKKRDHLREKFPVECEICGRQVSQPARSTVTCTNCRTTYERKWKKQGSRRKRDGWVRVYASYEHEFARVYREATGGDPSSDLAVWKQKIKEDLEMKRQMLFGPEDLDALAEEVPSSEPEPFVVKRTYSPELQEKVDSLLSASLIARALSVAMAQSGYNATRRIVAFTKMYAGDANPLLSKLQAYLALMKEAGSARLLPYEALAMKQYWAAYGLALRGAQVWTGPRKRSRFVAEYIEEEAGRARGYSPVDAAINYLHQRRLRQAERINREVGFPGVCDGFLHREKHNSRRIGVLFDMIDPFKFADREELLLVALNQGLTWRDFRIEIGRRGSGFYYPTAAAIPKLDHVGEASDGLVVKYQGEEMRLSEAYKQFAADLLRIVESRGNGGYQFSPFVFDPSDAQNVLQ